MNGKTMDVKLAPCPFCGGECHLGTVTYNGPAVRSLQLAQDTFFKVSCAKCGVNNLGVVGYATEAEAVTAWNTRAPINRPSPEAGESGLVESLRYLVRRAGPGELKELHAEAADTITRLQAELAEARKERDGARSQAAPVVDETELRPSVLAFARLMEAKLRANDHKSGWSGEDFFDLFDRLIEETSELHNALCRHAKRISWGDSWVMEDTKAWVGEEAADVANFAMMIADVCAALEAALAQEQSHER